MTTTPKPSLIHRISDFLYQKVSTRNILIFFILDLVFIIGILPACQKRFDPNNEIGPIDLLFGFTPEKAYGMLGQMGEAGRSFYLFCEAVVDIIYPMVYVLFFGLLISLLLSKTYAVGSPWRRLNIIPVIGGIFDLFENTSIVSMILFFEQKPAILAQIGSLMNMGKWICFGASVFMVLFGLVRWGIKGFKK